jgi:hypothetical protein
LPKKCFASTVGITRRRIEKGATFCQSLVDDLMRFLYFHFAPNGIAQLPATEAYLTDRNSS